MLTSGKWPTSFTMYASTLLASCAEPGVYSFSASSPKCHASDLVPVSPAARQCLHASSVSWTPQALNNMHIKIALLR